MLCFLPRSTAIQEVTVTEHDLEQLNVSVRTLLFSTVVTSEYDAYPDSISLECDAVLISASLREIGK